MKTFLKRLTAALLLASVSSISANAVDAAPTYRVIGQPNLAGTTLASRCAGVNARFNFRNDGGFAMYGPSGIAIDPRGRIFITDFGGRRVLTWPNFDALAACASADAVIGAGQLSGPEAVAFDPQSGALFVADTLSHTVKGYRKVGASWTRFVTLGQEGVAGAQLNRFNFPRGLAVDPGGRLFVADDFNNRILIFDPSFTNGEQAADSIGAGSNGGFDGPKAVAMSGNTLFVADYAKHRVLRFTGPFRTPAQVYVASGAFTGVGSPVDLAVHADGSLLVTDQQNRRIARYNDAVWSTRQTPTSTFAENIGPEPLGVAADRSGRIYIADYRRFRVLVRNEAVRKAPVTAGATAGVTSLLATFHARVNRATDRVAIGQQLLSSEYGPKSDPNAWYGDWRQLQQRGLPLPEIMGAETSDLMRYGNFFPNQDALNELIRHGEAGHPVTLVWHPDCPCGGGAFQAPVSTAVLVNAINDATPQGKVWQTQLNRAAAVLQKFETAGVPVIFRPLHEQNGTFFWWGDNGTRGAALRARQQAWVALWRDLVTELTVRKGLKNLIFVFGTNQLNYREVVPPLTYYPGANWADMVSIDVYDEELDLAGDISRGLRHYAALVSTGKPFGLAEFGQSYDENGTGAGAASWDARTLTTRIRDSYPRTVFAIAWYSSVEGNPPVPYVLALPDVSFTPQLLADPLIDTQ
jgi:mannan endo-1,4-beta-mannosidase